MSRAKVLSKRKSAKILLPGKLTHFENLAANAMEPPSVDKLPANPYETCNLFSRTFFLYTFPVFYKSQKKSLGQEDLHRPLKEHKADILGRKLLEAWEVEVRTQTKLKKKPKLRRPVLQVFGGLVITLGIILFCLDFSLKLTQPIFLGMLVSHYLESSDTSQAYYYAGAVVLCSILNVLCTHRYMLSQFHCGMKIRIALMSLIYRKMLRLSKTTIGNVTTGKIMNLLTNDVGKIDNALSGLHQIWLGPLETITVIGLVYYQIGWSAVAGILILGFLSPFQFYMGKLMSKFRAETAVRSDKRIRLMNEIIKGVQVIKMYAWEKPFGKLVELARKEEIEMIRKTNYIRGVNLSCMMFVSRIAIFASLVAYALLGQIVTAEKAFVITAYYNILRQVMIVQFPRGIEQLGETRTSLERIEGFMLLENRKTRSKSPSKNSDPTVLTPLLQHDPENITPVKLEVDEVRAKWDENHGSIEGENYVLSGISFEVSPGEKVAIVGHVGAGKSSILHAILGELPLSSGTVSTGNGVISYASQEPWLFNGSIRDNIVFGQVFDEKRYDEVIEACALKTDLEEFANGDRTIVGDRGQTLSGGQKARIGLARAVYLKADIYLLDDPLSAVDMQVGRHLVDQCINGHLRDRLVVLVTHQLQFLDSVERIIVIDHGEVEIVGKFSELKATHPAFAELNKAESDHGTSNIAEADQIDGYNDQDKSAATGRAVGIAASAATREQQKQGSVGVSLYVRYIQLGGGFVIFAIVMLFCIGTQFFASVSDYFLAYWVNREANFYADFPKSNATLKLDSPQETMSVDMFPIYIFTVLTAGTVFVTLFRTYLIFEVATRASRRLHNVMYNGVTRAVMYFFHTNPAGRIINRFSKDMGFVDETLPSVMIEVIQIGMALIGVIVIVAIINIWSLLPTVIMAVCFFYLRRCYLNASRNLRRMDGIARSPMYSHVIETIGGVSTIQAFSAEDRLTRAFDSHQDMHSSVYFTLLATGRAFGFWLDTICVCYIVFVTYAALDSDSAGEVGLAITQAVGVTGMLQWGVRQSAEMENLMTSVERIVEYDSIDKEEAKEEIETDQSNPESWPEKGSVKFTNVSLWYSPKKDATPALKAVNFEIAAGQKIGVVGRTGAGKSSLANALFRLSYIDGAIEIDGKNIESVAIGFLRSKLSIIPQEPILFSGSVRYNLDPFDEYSDDRIWSVLKEVNLQETVSGITGGLQGNITEGGSNLSIGEKQLVCLARALLRENKILVMDEATANVDRQTDALIQSTIRHRFEHSTVIIIAHRLHTVIDLDKIMVLDAGNLVEFDDPKILLADEKSVLSNMAKSAGQATYDELVEKAIGDAKQ